MTARTRWGSPSPLNDWFEPGPGARLRPRHSLGRQRRPDARLIDNRKRARTARRTSHGSGARSGVCCRLELWQQRVPRPGHRTARCSKRGSHQKRGGRHEGPHHRRRRIHRLAPGRPPARPRRRGARHRQLRDRPARQPRPAREARRWSKGRSPIAISSTRVFDAGSARAWSSTRRPSYKDPDDWAEDARTNVVGTAQRRSGAAARGCPTAHLLPDRALLRPAARSNSRSRCSIRSDPRAAATPSARRPASSTSALSGLDCDLLPPGQRLRAAQPERPAADVLLSGSPAASRASSWTPAATSSTSTTWSMS